MYINDACKFIFTHQQGLVVRFLTEPKPQSLSNKVFEFEFSLSFSVMFVYVLRDFYLRLGELEIL